MSTFSQINQYINYSPGGGEKKKKKATQNCTTLLQGERLMMSKISASRSLLEEGRGSLLYKAFFCSTKPSITSMSTSAFLSTRLPRFLLGLIPRNMNLWVWRSSACYLSWQAALQNGAFLFQKYCISDKREPFISD